MCCSRSGRPVTGSPAWFDRPEFAAFEEIWFVDFEFISRPGEHPDVLCLCAYELRTGRRIQLWDDQLGLTPPYRTDDRALFVCFAATAECGCHLARGWPLPSKVLDLSPMFRCYINGRKPPPEGKGLVGALRHFGLDTAGEKYKEAMRTRILQGRPFSPEEIARHPGILLERRRRAAGAAGSLLERMPPHVTLDTLLHWGEFAAVSAVMEHNGVPIDMEIASSAAGRRPWAFVRDALVPSINRNTASTSKMRPGSGASTPSSSRSTATKRASCGRATRPASSTCATRPSTAWRRRIRRPKPLRQLRHTQSQMREVKLAIGRDGRNRTVLWPFVGKTGRSQPKAVRMDL